MPAVGVRDAADTISVPMLMANASEVIAPGENATLATTRRAAATPTASHERKRNMVMLL
jgi:hypothetical protein